MGAKSKPRCIELEVLIPGSRSTVATCLCESTFNSWTQTSCVTTRAPDFLKTATPDLELYERLWDSETSMNGDIVVCADEKTAV